MLPSKKVNTALKTQWQSIVNWPRIFILLVKDWAICFQSLINAAVWKGGQLPEIRAKTEVKKCLFDMCFFFFCFVFFLSLFFLMILLSTFPLVPNTLPGNIRERTHAHRFSVGKKIPEKKSKIDPFSFHMLLT